MSNIRTPRTRLVRGREKWIDKKHIKANSQPTKMERTGQDTFIVKHDDGSTFECRRDPKKLKFKEELGRDAGGTNRFHISDNLTAKNVMSNKDRVRLGLEPDPDLPE